ncbi:uncharacterized protein LOC143609466 [Bidens hawaiensis]|uniref:uncharacterized protein LOC143609466 n=1 Tax=Bidens hawaiensis TaxID=980011 RepID=UPI004049F91E
MVDESRDESKKEQMAIVLRFVDAKGMIQERFLDLVHVTDTLSATLKTSLWKQLSHYQNMRGERNRLPTLVRCPYAYYVHCFAHRLQLALVCASRKVIPIHKFFNKLVFTINVVCASSKRHDELQKAKAEEIKTLLEMGEIKSGSGLNQVGTLRRAGDTHWGSHFNSICSLIDMFGATQAVLQGTVENLSHTTFSHRRNADKACDHLESFKFVFILYLMKKILGKTETLSQALQKKSQDILNAMELVSSTKANLNEFRNNGCESFLSKICLLVKKYYPEDFTEQEITLLQFKLQNFNFEMPTNNNLSGVSSIADLCKSLVETQKRETYYLVDRVVRLILTLRVSKGVFSNENIQESPSQ